MTYQIAYVYLYDQPVVDKYGNPAGIASGKNVLWYICPVFGTCNYPTPPGFFKSYDDAAYYIWYVLKECYWIDYYANNQTCPPCTPNWQCEPGQTGYEIDGCGNRRANPACAYREASLVSCMWPQNPIAGQAYQIGITVNQGSMTENYKLVFSGDFVGESAPFTVNAGTGQQQFTAGNLVFTAGGAKNITASLVKV